MNRPLIGFTGPIGSGKSTLAMLTARAMLSIWDRDYCLFAFAGPVKSAAKGMGWNGKKDAAGRRLLQLLGTECGRKCIGENVWVDAWRTAVEAEYSEGRMPLILADDVRFANEAAAIRALGGIIVRVDRPDTRPWFVRLLARLRPKHASERFRLGTEPDLVVRNYGTPEDLFDRAKEVLFFILDRMEQKTQ